MSADRTEARAGRAVRRLCAALLAAAGAAASACPLCLGWGRPSLVQQVAQAQQVVLARPAAAAGHYEVIAPIKGARPPGGVVEAAPARSGPVTTEGSGRKPLVLMRDGDWPVWTLVGSLGAEHAGALRKLAAGKPPAQREAADWAARVVQVLPWLGHAEPLLAQTAYQEIASAPYPAMLAARPHLRVAKLRAWLADPALAACEPVVLLLLGIAGDAGDAQRLERRLDAAAKAGDATNLGPLIAADLQLRGPARMGWVEATYLRDAQRSSRELQAALLALSVQGHADAAIPRTRVIAAYRVFIQANPPLAGLVATDLAAWQYWDAVPAYTALLDSGVPQHFESRAQIVQYLRRSPGGPQAAAQR